MTDKIKTWYKEALKVSNEFRVTDGDRFIIYKGFKITSKVDGTYLLQDTRYDDFYTPVTSDDLSIIEDRGFVRGVDEINHELNLKRVELYTKRVEYLYAKRSRAKKEMKQDVRLNKKRVRLANKNIDILVDQMFLFESRIEQFNIKYKKEG